MEKHCGACGASRLRPSRFRLSDIPLLFAFRYPVRCLECMQRSSATFSWVMGYRRRKGTRRK
jgi:hypothetical protein